MMKLCCLIVIILCIIGVSTGRRLTKNCVASNGTCGRKGVTCDAAFGEGWIEKGKCCYGKPCCKLPCVPTTTCPEGYVQLDDQSISPNCYLYDTQTERYESWASALSICTMTPGASLWRPNSEAEALTVYEQFQIFTMVWTGAYSPDQDGHFVFAADNGIFNYTNVPFGSTYIYSNSNCIAIDASYGESFWGDEACANVNQYICELPWKTCP